MVVNAAMVKIAQTFRLVIDYKVGNVPTVKLILFDSFFQILIWIYWRIVHIVMEFFFCQTRPFKCSYTFFTDNISRTTVPLYSVTDKFAYDLTSAVKVYVSVLIYKGRVGFSFGFIDVALKRRFNFRLCLSYFNSLFSACNKFTPFRLYA